MATKEELIRKIKNASNAQAHKSMDERTRKINDVHGLYTQALTRMREVKDLCDIVNAAIENGYAIECGPSFVVDRLPDAPELCTDGINHRLGFYGKSMNRLTYIDFTTRYHKIGYKADGVFDFYTDGEDIYFGDKSYSLYNPDEMFFNRPRWTSSVGYIKAFIKDFDVFKAKVYDFVENIDKYKCYM